LVEDVSGLSLGGPVEGGVGGNVCFIIGVLWVFVIFREGNEVLGSPFFLSEVHELVLTEFVIALSGVGHLDGDEIGVIDSHSVKFDFN